MGTEFGVDDLLNLSGSNREAKAYAFLYAAFRRTEVSSNPVRDALDCLIPFIAPYLNDCAGNQVTADGVRSYLLQTFGFNLPLYAVEQIFASLQNHGFVEYIKTKKIHIAKSQVSNFHVAKRDIESDYDEIVEDLQRYAGSVGFLADPPAGGWGEALIDFLRQNTEKKAAKLTSVKSVLIDPGKVEEAIVAAYVRRLSSTDKTKFNSLTNIFMGALIEDFISSVSELGSFQTGNSIGVFYDTAVILRLLGCSGRLLKVATEELTRYLQDVGCQIYYLSGNEAEVSNILDTIVYVKDSGKEVEGETAEALSLGEVTITDLRMLQNTFPEKLATYNVFPAGELERISNENQRYQIDERGFADYLFRQATASGRAYGIQNRQNDASYVAAIMRLRAGSRSRDFTDSGSIFVTPNKFLAYAARKYLIEQRNIAPKDCPPILSLGQVATIAWLMKDQVLTPEKAGRELLLNCYAAVHPDAEWFGYFREGMERVVGSVEEFAKDGSNALALQAARRIAGEESFGHSMIVRELNMAEILARAQEEETAMRREWQEEAERTRQNAKAELDAERLEAERIRAQLLEESRVMREDAIRRAADEAEVRTQKRIAAEKLAIAETRAGRILGFTKWVLLLLFCICTASSVAFGSGAGIVFSLLLALASIVAFADLLRLAFLTRLSTGVRRGLVGLLLKL